MRLNRKYTTFVVIRGIRRNVVKRQRINTLSGASNGIPPIRSSGEDVGGITKGPRCELRSAVNANNNSGLRQVPWRISWKQEDAIIETTISLGKL
jgi:hypothetical protein